MELRGMGMRRQADPSSTHKSPASLSPAGPHSTRVHPSRSTGKASSTSKHTSASDGSHASTDTLSPAAPNPIPSTAASRSISHGKHKTSRSSAAASSTEPATITAKVGPGLLNATLPPEGFAQCQPALVNITAEANQSVAVAVLDYHDILQRLDVTIPPPVTEWNWTVVDFPAGTELRVEVAVGGGDVSSPEWASWVGLSHVHAGRNVTSCLDGDDMDSPPPRKSHSSHLGTILGVSIPLGLFLIVVMSMIGLMIWRRKRERRDRAAQADDPVSRMQDWQDRASMMWENSSRGWMRNMVRPDTGSAERRRAVSLDSSTNVLDPVSSPYWDDDTVDELPTYKQSQRISKRLHLPTYTRASTFTRAVPSNQNLTTSLWSTITLAPATPDTEADTSATPRSSTQALSHRRDTGGHHELERSYSGRASPPGQS